MIGALAVGRIRVAQSTGGREAVPPVAVHGQMRRCEKSNLVDCMTDRSAGFSPLRIFPAQTEASRSGRARAVGVQSDALVRYRHAKARGKSRSHRSDLNAHPTAEIIAILLLLLVLLRHGPPST